MDACRGERLAAAAIVVGDVEREVREVEAAAFERAAAARVATGMHQYWVQHAPVRPGCDQSRSRPVKAAPRQLDDLADAARRRTGAQVIGHALGLPQLAEHEDRIGDK